MKKNIFKFTLVLFTLNFMYSQDINHDYTFKSETLKTFRLEKISKTEFLFFDVTNEKGKVDFHLNSLILSGKLLIEIFDPNNKKFEQITLESKTNNDRDNNTSNSQINKIIDPKVGRWTAKITFYETTGELKINTSTTE